MKTEIDIVKVQTVEELDQLISVFQEVFEMQPFSRPSQSHLSNLLKKENFIAFVVRTGGKIVGGLTAYVLDQYYSEKPLAYIYDLAVLVEHQRKGIGRRLINCMNDYCQERGFEEVFVQADKIEEHVVEFYRSTKPTDEEQVVHFYYKLHH